ncbi:MAG TPA: cytochrome c biogenesis protein CcdA [Candidatus Methanoperedens sp.]|nr:sulfite exporter TauE/SafE family protein [Candidatus Methanoperedens sp.]HLB72308.1 cytochrome c biogenesis protein CcdA [Candidatus Methanoperedens sp.]
MKNRAKNMKYLAIALVIVFFTALGCLGSAYKDTAASELRLNPGSFEGKKVCIEGVIENSSISGVQIGKSENFTGEFRNWTFSKVCGIYEQGRLDAEIINQVLTIVTDKEVYHSNETLKVRVDFYSKDNARAQIQVSGIKNAFDAASIKETRDVEIIKGVNSFDFEFKTPSCEECTAVSPGEHVINATVSTGGRSFETYSRIMLERSTNDSGTHINNVTNAPIDNGQISSGVAVEYFYDPACQKCEKAFPVIERTVSSYGDRVNFSKYDIRADEGLQLAKKYQLPGVPSVVINKIRVISYEDYDGDTSKLETLLKEAIENIPASPVSNKIKPLVLSVPSVLVVGFLAGFNPCLLAILAFIASITLATTGKRRDVVLIVLMFSLGIFMTYLIVGIGLLRIFEYSTGLQVMIRNFLVVLIGVLGLWHVYDAYHLRKNTESSFYTPKAFVRLTESVTKKVSLPASFFIGALFSLIKAPCVGAVYLVILDMVRSGSGEGLMYLAAYNLGVVLPVLVLGAGIAFGLNPEKVEKFRKERRSVMRLITGATLLVIAVLMYAGII